MRNEGNGKLRLLYIYKLLKEETDEDHMLSTVQIVKALKERFDLDAHRITVGDDIRMLQQVGVEIGKVETTQNKYWLQSRPLEQAELKVLIDAVASSKVITKKHSKELIQKVAQLGSPFKQDDLVRNISPENRVKAKNENIIYNVDAVNTAIIEEKKISFKYFCYDANKRRQVRNGGEPYTFSPWALVWNGDYYYAVGWSDKHNDIGSFRLDRMYNVPEMLNDSAVHAPKGFRLANYIKTNYHMFGGRKEAVELFCDGDVMDAIIDRFGYDVDTELQSDGRFITKAEVAVNNVFFGWIFGFGGKVKIISPQYVAEEYLKMVTDALQIEQGPQTDTSQ